MTLCVFVLIASEFLPVSLLTPIASDLRISEGLAGQGIAISGALAVVTSLTISRLAGGINRKYLLLGLTALMAISGVIIALAPVYPVYMLGRALIGVVIGGFWSMSAATAIRLVPQHQVPRALAIFNGGTAQGSLFRLLRVSIVPVGLLACGLFFMGQFALFTYVRPFLESVTRVNASGLSWILLAIGIAGFVGTLLVSSALNARFYLTLILIPLLMAAIAGTLLLTAQSVWTVAFLLSLWGGLATAAPTGWWTWIARTLPDDAEAGGGLMVAVIQLSIALGSTAGGLAFDILGWRSAFALSGVLLLAAAAMTVFISRQK
jgi:predicted MFS family arabinose efflux permease